MKCLEEDREQRFKTLRILVAQLEGALRPSRPLSEILAHGKLHELAAAVEQYTPRDFAKLPAGQRALILAKLSDIVASGDPRLEYASEIFLRLLLTRGLYLSRGNYSEIVVPAIAWAFEHNFDGRLGKKHLREALEQAAAVSEEDGHSVLVEEFSKFLIRTDLDQKETWLLHSMRDVIEALLANPACIGDANQLVNGLRKINEIQRSRPSGAWQSPSE